MDHRWRAGELRPACGTRAMILGFPIGPPAGTYDETCMSGDDVI
ncbi:MAG: hypothetical protein ACFE9C_11350 [Candidatus Hodarchaeota archaeon]